MPISLLDRETVKLISTSQIITSVSSAAKELIENAFDANAGSIEVNLTDSGLSLIEVKDDGCGISKEDAVYVGLASYTSKISNFSDLESLKTYGFRGEAISALCAVADVTIITKTQSDDAAISYKLNHFGQIEALEMSHRANGTTVQVRNLFKLIPVRRQIISNPRKASQDVKQLEALIRSYGICKFHTRVSYRVDNNIIFAKPSMNTMKDAVSYILGKKLVARMSWIESENTELNVRFMVPSKEITDINMILQTGAQYIFVNNRPVKNKDLEKITCKIILEGLKQESSTKKKPVFLLSLSMDASNVDVNLEPNKTEVMFRDQQNVVDTIDACLKHFYGIELEEKGADNTLICSEEYSIDGISDPEKEWPVCKKRKLQIDGKIKEESRNIDNTDTNKRDVKQDERVNKEKDTKQNIGKLDGQQTVKEQGPVFEQAESWKKSDDVEAVIDRLQPPDLSDSDSNQSLPQNGPSNKLLSIIEKDRDENPPSDSSSNTNSNNETLSQLPVVDLGDDFYWCEIISRNKRCDSSEKENSTETKEQKPDEQKQQTLDAWSKGQMSGLKGGTDVKPYVANYNQKFDGNEMRVDEYSETHGTTGFTVFSSRMRPQIEKKNPDLSVAQIAYKITSLWKELTSEERGYYRDLALEEKRECELKKKAKKGKSDAKNKKCLISMLEKMKDMKTEKKENLVMRTTRAWEINLDNIKEGFYNSSIRRKAGLIVGSVSENVCLVNISSHIWALDVLRLKKAVNFSSPVSDQENQGSMEEFLKLWLKEEDDLSLLHPLYSIQ